MKKERVGILTGGGDCAGLNAAVKWATKGLLDEHLQKEYGRDFEVVGIKNGWGGLQNYSPDENGNDPANIMHLDPEVVRTWDRHGGTNLFSSRTNPFKNEESVKKTLENIAKLDLTAIIAIGGEDTQSVSMGLTKKGINVVSIPKTIDKDLIGTDYSLGFATAVEVIKEEIGRLRTTAGSHNRIFVVETMGRHAGHLALQGGIAGGACMILIPEVDFELEKVVKTLENRKQSGARYDILVVAEGAKPIRRHDVVLSKELDEFGHVLLGGVGENLAKEIKKAGFAEVRFVVLSHLQRGGEPSQLDIRMGRAFGLAAAELVAQRAYGLMVCLQDNTIKSIPILDAIRKDENGVTMTNRVNVETEYDKERYIATRRTLGMKMN
jgi:ATP-dependent phosphofructokinase / diphosphate-dependent phosphofructokinase